MKLHGVRPRNQGTAEKIKENAGPLGKKLQINEPREIGFKSAVRHPL